MRSPSEIIRSFAGKRILIAGDMVADQFLHGTIARVSREAPVFILQHDETNTLPGGAANAAVNVASLGGEPILVGALGTDLAGKLLSTALEKAGVSCRCVVTDERVQTTTKVRVLAGQHYAPRQQVIRIDYGRSGELPEPVTAALCSSVEAEAANAAAIVLSDYNYGVLSPVLFECARAAAEEYGIPLVLDSRFRLTSFPGATSATPNQDEVEQILGKHYTNADCEDLRGRLRLDALLVTRGNKGMTVFEKGEVCELNAVGPTEPVDVTGAGDTVIAAYSLGLAAGLSFRDAAAVANHAGGIVVMKKGTASASAEELRASLELGAQAAEKAV